MLKFGKDVYVLPCKTKLLVKRIKSVNMDDGIVTMNYTQLVWINVKGAPKEISDKFEPDENFKLKYRIEFQEESVFDMENSAIRRKNDEVTITFRGE